MEKIDFNEKDSDILKEIEIFKNMTNDDKLITVSYDIEIIKKCLNIVCNALSTESFDVTKKDIYGALNTIMDSADLLLTKLKI